MATPPQQQLQQQQQPWPLTSPSLPWSSDANAASLTELLTTQFLHQTAGVTTSSALRGFVRSIVDGYRTAVAATPNASKVTPAAFNAGVMTHGATRIASWLAAQRPATPGLVSSPSAQPWAHLPPSHALVAGGLAGVVGDAATALLSASPDAGSGSSSSSGSSGDSGSGREEPAPAPAPYNANAGPAALARMSGAGTMATSAEVALIARPPIVAWREVDNVVYINSGDRDWAVAPRESRYAFSVQFGRSAAAPGLNEWLPLPSVLSRFRNVLRVELVKAALPAERLGTAYDFVADASGGLFAGGGPGVTGLPYVAIRIEEIGGNAAGTNDAVDRALGLLHQDAHWESPAPLASSSASPGYVSLVPKHLHALQEFTPTPLASLQRLSVRLERPWPPGALLDDAADALPIGAVWIGGTNPNATPFALLRNTAIDGGTVIMLQLSSFVLASTVLAGERIVLNGPGAGSAFAPSGAAATTASDFVGWLTRAAGHHVLAVGYTGANCAVTVGANASGFINLVALPSRFDAAAAAASGALTRSYFGGSSDAEAALRTQLLSYTLPSGGGALLNMNRQTHLVLRVVTRMSDGVSELRPDNAGP